MKKEDYRTIHKFLGNRFEEEIRYIELQLSFAKDVRAYQLEYSVSDHEFSREYGCEVDYVARLRKGAVDISTKDMAKLRGLYAKRIDEERAETLMKNTTI